MRFLARVQVHHVLGADDCLEALLPVLAVLPRLGLRAAGHAHAAALVQALHATLGQLLPRLDRGPVGLEHALARFASPGRPLGRNPKAAHCRARRNEARAAAPPRSIRPTPPDLQGQSIWVDLTVRLLLATE